jgi:hypothetical protein
MKTDMTIRRSRDRKAILPASWVFVCTLFIDRYAWASSDPEARPRNEVLFESGVGARA